MNLWEMNIRKTENRVKFESVFTELLLFEHNYSWGKKKIREKRLETNQWL